MVWKSYPMKHLARLAGAGVRDLCAAPAGRGRGGLAVYLLPARPESLREAELHTRGMTAGNEIPRREKRGRPRLGGGAGSLQRTLIQPKFPVNQGSTELSLILSRTQRKSAQFTEIVQ